MPEQLGWLDTNLFVHALFPREPHHARCRAIVRALEEGRAEGWLDPLVVHELSYVLSRLGQRFPTRTAIEEYLRGILLIDAIHADDKAGLLEAVARWEIGRTGFADAWLAVRARRRGLPVCSVNQADFGSMPNTFLTARL